MSKNKLLATATILVTLASYALLIPGITLPFMELKLEIKVLAFNATLLDETRSLLTTSERLYDLGYPIVAALVLLFSTIIPSLKGLLLIAYLCVNESLKKTLFLIINVIAKWSMADVFVAGILVSFLSAKANEQLTATLLEGFYYFLGYCLLSILSGQLLQAYRNYIK